MPFSPNSSSVLRWARLPQEALAKKLTEPGGYQMLCALAISVSTCTYFTLTSERSEPPSKTKIHATDNKKQNKTTKKSSTAGNVDRDFFKRFLRLLKIAFPTLVGREMLYLLLLTSFLLLRTVLSLKISAVTGSLAKTMIQTDFDKFVRAIGSLAAWSVPASTVNSGLKYLTTLLQLRMRHNVGRHLHKLYLQSRVTYPAAGLGAVDTIDQRITKDVDLWCADAAELYTTVFKPFIDVVLFSREIAKYGGYKGPGLIIFYYGLISFLMRVLMPNFGSLTAHQQKLEAELRSGHTRLMHFSEEIRFLDGIDLEHSSLDALFHDLYRHARFIAERRAEMGVFDAILVKYGSVLVGYAVCAMSMFSKEAAQNDEATLTGLYMKNSQLLQNLARAVGQIIMTYKKLTALSGYTSRVGELVDSLEQVKANIKRNGSGSSNNTATGVYKRSHRIAFDNVPIVPPDGTVLVKGLNFHVDRGMNVLILGPNGCGKSSSFRFLGELWRPLGGVIEKPEHSAIYYVPQRPYMCEGTLRDQVVYPHSTRDVAVSDEQLMTAVELAGLLPWMKRHGYNWDSVQDWSREALSHGDKQKMAMARLYYHKPKFAILDECSSAIDVELEARLYATCAELGISVITVAHRRTVWKYHNWVLKFDGDGGYVFSPMSLDERTGVLTLTKVKTSDDPKMLGARLTVDPSKAAMSHTRVEEQN
eukprot:PhM_4_TR13361/c0_g1_i1/m.81873